MENASKALFIAGAILLALLIIGLGVFIYTNASTTVSGAANMDQLEVARFNGQFEPYINKEISGTTAKSLIKTIESSNFASEPQVYCAGATQRDVKKAHTYETLVEYDHGVITQILIKDKDDNVIIGNEAGNGGNDGPEVILTQAYVNGFFLGYLDRSLTPAELRTLLNNLDQCNSDIAQYQDSVIYNVSYVTYVGPNALEIDDSKTYTATAEMNKNEYIMLLTVTQNKTDRLKK